MKQCQKIRKYRNLSPENTNWKSMLFHVNLSLFIPLIISIIIFFNQAYFSLKYGILMILFMLTCSTQMLLPGLIIYNYPLNINLQSVLLISLAILFRIFFLILFVLIHNKRMKISIFSNSFLTILNIIVGFILLFVSGKI